MLHVAAEDRWSVDAHDPPPPMAEQVRLRDEHCLFPWCTRPARQCDLDHRDPHQPSTTPHGDAGHDPPHDGAPRGQTTPANLGPLCRRHPRAKTAGSWSYERLDPGTYLWTGPASLTALVTPGNHPPALLTPGARAGTPRWSAGWG